MNYCEYDEITGRILSVGNCPDTTEAKAFAHFTNPVLLGIPPSVRGNTHFVEDGRAEPFPVKPGEHYEWDWVTQEWVPDLEGARSAKASAIDTTCRNTILSGFKSSALGAEHHYPAKLTDQSNLSGSIIDSLLPGLSADWVTPFWCMDATGVWEFRLHTATQIQQVGRDGKLAILAAMGKNEQLQSLIALATTLEEINQINW